MPTQNNPGDINLSADQAIMTLRESRKEITGEHDERIRLLQKLKANILTASKDPELITVDSMLSPEIKRLLDDPLRGF